MPLICKSFIEKLIDIFKLTFPLSHSMMMISTYTTEYCSPLQCDRPVIIKKNYHIFERFLSMYRLKNVNLLTNWAFVEALSKIVRGILKVENQGNIICRYSLSYTTLFKKLKQFEPLVRESNCGLL